MPTYRIPVLHWLDHEGCHTAALVEWQERTALARSRAAVKEQLTDYTTWLYRERPWWPAPDFLDPQLVRMEVPIRPEYRLADRPYPCDEIVTLTVPCVYGRQEGGLLVCSIPTLDLRFYYYKADSLSTLVRRSVTSRLQGLKPQDLARFLPPKAVNLDEIVLRLPARRKVNPWQPTLTTLTAVAEPLAERALRRQFARAWEREKEVLECARRLRKERANVLIVGDPGSGKTTVVVQAVQSLTRQPLDKEDEEERQDELAPVERRFWLTSAARLIAGMKYLGQWEERCEAIIAELGQVDGVLCVDNLLDLVRNGGQSPTSSLAAFFLPYLQRGELRMVCEATAAELDACRRLLPGFADLFQTIPLKEFTRAQAVSVLDRVATSARAELKVDWARGVIDLIYRLFRRFAPYDAFPGKASAFVADLFERTARARQTEVTTDLAVAHFVRRTGLPERFLRDDQPLPRNEVVETFRRQVIGQDQAIATVANLVTTFKAGLNDPERPVGVLLFCGPTGVGKTELARAISRYFFGHGEQKDRLIRLDMSEYTGPGAATRLVSQPNGEPSELVKKVRQQPFVVLLLDEVEKADPEVFDMLLGVFDEGRLADRYGRLTVFRSAVILMTSNLGAGQGEALGFVQERAVHYDREALSFFRPEFFNRIDAVVTFAPLTSETVRAIARKELSEVANREGLARLGLRLTWDVAVEERLAQDGFDPRYGARPLQRTLETLVVTPLARFLLEHPELRDTTVRVVLSAEGRTQFLC